MSDITGTAFRVAEKFLSINGEGLCAGKPAAFIRFTGCNLRCSYCDTRWANDHDCPYEILTVGDIVGYVRFTRAHCVTLTGGEPLLRVGISELCAALMREDGLRTEIETNGSVSIAELAELRKSGKGELSFTLDYKLPSSGMEKYMLTDNYRYLEKTDSVKFVCGSRDDLKRAAEIIAEYSLDKRCSTIFSPVFGRIEPKDIVDFMIENELMDSRFQLQIHKFVWAPEMRGV
ncbi:MAG: putative 7-carboxy-7-deazaguanine synthase QueE [Oscillospiraceae bacterium]|nr:putative 7-carboxy-7-deazaguanine synthase QueE [Oscillospiraceae bacterium]